MKRLLSWILGLHRHQWRGMEWDEWQQKGGMGSPDLVCDKCGKRAFWSETK